MTASGIGDRLKLDEPVLGGGGKNGIAKAYSASRLDGHEIVNDEPAADPSRNALEGGRHQH